MAMETGRFFSEEQGELALNGQGEQFGLSLVGGMGGQPDPVRRRETNGRFKGKHNTGRVVKTPLARATDPEGSHAGAEAADGFHEAQAIQVAAWLEANPGQWTGQEIARESGIDRYVVGRRLPEAELKGLVVRTDRRKCQVTGITVTTWMAKKHNGGDQ